METTADNAKKRKRREDTSADRKKQKGTNIRGSWTTVIDLSGSPSDDTDVDVTSYSSVVSHAQHGNHLDPWNAYPHTHIQPQQPPLVQAYAPPYTYNFAPNCAPGMSTYGPSDSLFTQAPMYPNWCYPTPAVYQAPSYAPYLAPEYPNGQMCYDGLPYPHWTGQHVSGWPSDPHAMNLGYPPSSQQKLENKENFSDVHEQLGKQAASQANTNVTLAGGWQSTTHGRRQEPSLRSALQERKNLQPPAPPGPMSRNDYSHAPELIRSGNTSASEMVQPLPTTICNCRRTDLSSLQKEITCANTSCKVGRYHAICVGLAKRDPAPDWKCRDCRQQPPGSTPASSQIISQVPSGPTEPSLSAQQQTVVDLILRGRRNVCYTGSAGTGKSTVLKAVVKELRDQGKTVDIIAPSGIAALAVGGQTVFSYAGWVPDTFKMGLQKIGKRAQGKMIRKRLCKTDVLIIEEISMVDADVLQRLDRSCREARDTASWSRDFMGSPFSKRDPELPFGGMQVVTTGDFCQLPPVKPFKFCLYCGGDELPGWSGNKGQPVRCLKCKRMYEDNQKWAFRSQAWDSCQFAYVELTEIHRQSDPVFTEILQKTRRSIPLTAQDKQILLEHPSETKDAVHLRPTLAEVWRLNEDAFKVLPGPTHTYDCWDTFSWREELHPELHNRGWRRDDGRWQGRADAPLKAFQDHRFEERLQLKLNTLVILLVNMNLEQGLVNGAQGKVVGFQRYSKDGPADPQAPVSSFLPTAVGDYKEVRDRELKDFTKERKVTAWPVVKFNNGITQIIYAQCQLSELGLEKPYSLMSRTQMPLIPAWAITVHKSQGMTLTKVEVDLSRAFEREMIYVALSRCKTLEGLKVHRLPRDMRYGPDATVQEFLTKFTSAGAFIRPAIEGGRPKPSGSDARNAIMLE